MNQRDSVGIGIGRGGRRRGLKLYENAHLVLDGSYRGVVIHTRGVEGIEEVNESVVYEFFQVEEELTNCTGDFSRVVPPENVYNGALINGMIRVDDLWSRKVKEGVNGNEDHTDRIVMNGTSPLEIVVSCYRKQGSDVSFPEGGEGTVIGLVD